MIVTTAYLGLYLTFEEDLVSPWIFYLIYMSIFEYILFRRLYNSGHGGSGKSPVNFGGKGSNSIGWRRRDYLILGVSLVFFNVGILETVGHGYYEHHHSYVLEFFNSVFHTPLYGINSVLLSSGLRGPRDDHICW